MLALCIRWPKDWSFSFSPSNEYSGLISFRIDRFDLLAVQGTLKSLPQYHSSKASILWRLAFVMVQLSHPYMTTGKTVPLTIWTFVAKVMSPLFKRLPRFVTSFLPIVNRCPNRDVKEGTIKLQLWVNFQEITEDSNPSSPVHYLCDSGCARLTLHCKMGTTLLNGRSEKTKEAKYWRALPSTGIQSLWTLPPLPTGWQPLIRSWSQGLWKGCRISQVEEGKCSKVESGKWKHESKMLED